MTFDLAAAVKLVARDQTDNDFVPTVVEAIQYVLDVMLLPEEPYVPGGWHIDGDDEVAQAYIAVVRAEREGQTAEAIAATAGEEFAAEYAKEKAQ